MTLLLVQQDTTMMELIAFAAGADLRQTERCHGGEETCPSVTTTVTKDAVKDIAGERNPQIGAHANIAP